MRRPQRQQQQKLISGAVLIATTTFLFIVSNAAKEGETCVGNVIECNKGLHCQVCAADGKFWPRCTPTVRPLNPILLEKGLPFNRYSWLTTHNSFAKLGGKSAFGRWALAPENQQDSVTSQLINGVRGLMLDMYDFLDDIWLCHSFDGQCYGSTTAFQPAKNVLEEVRGFLQGNPTEVVTIFIEDYVTSPGGVTKVFDEAGLKEYRFPLSRMPKRGGNWPTIDQMIRDNHRLLVFTSNPSKEAAEGIAYQWRYVVESQYGDGGMKQGWCGNRAESWPMNTRSKSLVALNYFPDIPFLPFACNHNSAPLSTMLNTCFHAAGQRWPNFIAVDFYLTTTSSGFGASHAVDVANGRSLCGCPDVACCKDNGSYGECHSPTEQAVHEQFRGAAYYYSSASNTRLVKDCSLLGVALLGMWTLVWSF